MRPATTADTRLSKRDITLLVIQIDTPQYLSFLATKTESSAIPRTFEYKECKLYATIDIPVSITSLFKSQASVSHDEWAMLINIDALWDSSFLKHLP